MTLHRKIEQGFANLTETIYHRKVGVLFLVLILTVGLAIQSSKLKIDTRDESFFHDDDPTLLAYNEFRDTFGQDDTFIIGLKPDNGLTPEFFAVLFEIHKDLEATVPYLDDISSLVNGRIIRAEGDTLIVEDLMQKPPESDMELRFEKSKDTETAIRETMFSTGRALVITSIVLCGGFFTYTLSFLSSNAKFGLLSGCAVLFALAADFFLVPALLVMVYRKKNLKPEVNL